MKSVTGKLTILDFDDNKTLLIIVQISDNRAMMCPQCFAYFVGGDRSGGDTCGYMDRPFYRDDRLIFDWLVLPEL